MKRKLRIEWNYYPKEWVFIKISRSKSSRILWLEIGPFMASISY